LEQFFTLPIDMLGISILAIAALAWLVQVLYYLVVMNQTGKKPVSRQSNFQPPVSVIICARNESANLQKHLPLVLEQNYPNYEVVVVNDSSSDDSDEVLTKFKHHHPHLYFTTIPHDQKFTHSKKLALTVGIKAAKNEYLLLTDADCYPNHKDWISKMMEPYASNQTEIVIGYSPYEKKKGFLNRMVRYDTFWNAVQYLGMARLKSPFMAVGRNLSYTKSVFNRNNGFAKHLTIQSGDDDLFVSQAATKTNCSIAIENSAQTTSIAPESFMDWKWQKSRHFRTAPHYRTGIKLNLMTEVISRQLLWITAIVSVFFNTFAGLTIGALILKLIIQMLVLQRVSKRMGEQNVVWSALYLDFLLPIIFMFVHAGNLFRPKQIKWK
jgi:cellulose synthase/poly-beta-1,6-N-acetylglucosamine synthase-like glycosyltransferase